MKAAVFHKIGDISVDNLDDPKIEMPDDMIIRVTSTAICGSDLHLYNGYIPSMQAGDILGHEFMGEVIETGKATADVQPAGQATATPESYKYVVVWKKQKGGSWKIIRDIWNSAAAPMAPAAATTPAPHH